MIFTTIAPVSTSPSEFQTLVKRRSRKKRKHGQQQTGHRQYSTCKLGSCGKNIQKMSTSYSVLPSLPSGFNRINSNANQLIESSHYNFRHGSLPKNFYTEMYGINDRITSPNPFLSTPYHFNESKNYFNNIFPNGGTELRRLKAMDASQWMFKNKYNIDYDNKLEDEYEIIHKIE